jgi:hypothetical protein
MNALLSLTLPAASLSNTDDFEKDRDALPHGR